MLEKNYTPKDFEEKIYADWEKKRRFSTRYAFII